jgi:hypothetical protein
MTDCPEAPTVSTVAVTPNRVWLLAFSLSLATALAVISPFFWKGNASGHDFVFHASSWMEVAAQWRDGILLPRWAEGANHGFGEPRFIFYPPLSWSLGAALGFVVPWIYAPAVFIVLTQTLAGLSAFALGRRVLPQRGALFCAVCYAANPYALLIVYMRSDFAEQLALIFYPLLMLAALQVVGLVDAAPRHKSVSIALLAILFAAVWVSNAPAAVIATYSLAAIFAWEAIFRKSWRVVLYGTASLALGFALAGYYLLPAAYEQSWVNISQALSSGLQPVQNFLYTIIEDQEHNVFNHIASNAAVLLLTLTAIFAAAAYPRNNNSQARGVTKNVWTVLAVLTVVAAFLMIRISGIFWALLPKLRFVQFPWRWMSIVAVVFAFFAGAAISRRNMRWYWITLIIPAVAAILAITAAHMIRHTWWDAEDIPVLQQALDNDEGFEGTDEYDPVGDDHSNLPEKSSRVKLLRATDRPGPAPVGKIYVEQWSAERKELRIISRQPVRLALRLLNYPAWRVQVNDAAVLPERTEESNQIIVPLAAGASHVIVQFIRTPDRTLGGVITGTGLLIALFVLIRRVPT